MLKSKFDLGSIVATRPALSVLQDNGQSALDFVRRHSEGDWGEDLCQSDRDLNDEALSDGSRLMSSFLLNDGSKLWIITEASDENGKRIATTVLLPSCY